MSQKVLLHNDERPNYDYGNDIHLFGVASIGYG